MTNNITDKYQGCLLGLAIGDALGYTVEFSAVEDIKARFGPNGITDLVCSRTIDGKNVSPFSDDTQMTLAVCRGLIRAAYERDDVTCDSSASFVAEEFVEWSRHPPDGHRAPGGACMAGCRALAGLYAKDRRAGDEGPTWEHAGGEDAGGCGTAMRSAPYALFFDSAAAVDCAARHARMTHGHPLAAAASAAVAAGVSAALHGDSPQVIASAMIAAAGRYDAVTRGMLKDVVRLASDVTHFPEGAQAREATRVAVLDKYRGWAGHEAVAAALYCFLTNTDDYEQCMVDAANSPGDSDSIASIAGAIAGAYVGRAGIPEKWIQVIERSAELALTAATLAAIKET